MKQVESQMKKIITEDEGVRWTCNEMLKTVLFESESMPRKTLSNPDQTLSNLIQKD